jgi:hypothetical protein
MADVAAVEWAMSGNTTKTGKRPGGLGLQLIREFIELNQGRIIVVSSGACWRQTQDGISARELDPPFPGTVVTIEVNTADTSLYRLQEEVDPANVF